ncbi:MAG: hypothetical protein C0482_22220 [Gordonia sp.]|nr:hypothetical protein [Gordonia sp. (in: high G+C Gram-positive bacteria)]
MRRSNRWSGDMKVETQPGDPVGDMSEVDLLVAKHKIYENSIRYVQSVDRLNYDQMMSTYWPDSTDDHGNFSGSGPEWCDFVCKMAEGLVRTHHIVGNFLADVRGSQATVELYFRGIAIFKNSDGQSGATELHSAGRYKDLYERRGDEWKILRRSVIWDWSRQLPSEQEWSWLAEGAQFGGFYPDDPIYSAY